MCNALRYTKLPVDPAEGVEFRRVESPRFAESQPSRAPFEAEE